MTNPAAAAARAQEIAKRFPYGATVVEQIEVMMEMCKKPDPDTDIDPATGNHSLCGLKSGHEGRCHG